MKKNIVFITLLILNVLLVNAVTLDDLITNALENTDGLKAMQFKIKSMESREQLVQQIMNPMFMIEYSNVPLDSWKLDENPMSGIQLKLQQQITIPGKNQKREQIAKYKTELIRLDYVEMELELIKNIRILVSNMKALSGMEKVSEQHLQKMEILKKSLLAKYKTGKMKQFDIQNLSLMIEDLKDRIEDFEIKQLKMLYTLQDVTEIDDLSLEAIDLNFELSFNDLSVEDLALSYENNPKLMRSTIELNIHKTEQKLAKLNRFKDPSVWVGYRYRADIGQMEGVDLVSLGFSIPLPFDYKNKTENKVSLENSLGLMVEQKIDQITDELTTNSKKQHISYTRENERISEYKSNLIPMANSAYESVLLSYLTGKSDFNSIYQAEKKILEFEGKMLISQNNLEKAIIQLKYLSSENSYKGGLK